MAKYLFLLKTGTLIHLSVSNVYEELLAKYLKGAENTYISVLCFIMI